MSETDLATESLPTPLADYLAGLAARRETGLATGMAQSNGGAIPRQPGDSSSALKLMSYRGVLTPRRLDAPEAEIAALLHGAAMHDLGWMRRIAVRGEDRLRWLSGMVTNAVETLAAGSGTYDLVLNAQGRIQGDCFVWRGRGQDVGPDRHGVSGEIERVLKSELEIEVTAEQAESLLAHFERFIIMDDVELMPVAGKSALGLSGPGAERILTTLGLPVLEADLTFADCTLVLQRAEIAVALARSFGVGVPHFELWVADESIGALWDELMSAGAKPVGAESVEALRIYEGVPAYGVDIQSRDLAQETSQMRALSFTKGCYLGQEIVERVRSRGQVHRHLRGLELFPSDESSTELPMPGIELRVVGASPESKPAASLTSVAGLAGIAAGCRQRIFAVGMVRSEAEIGSPELAYEGGRARILTGPAKLTEV